MQPLGGSNISHAWHRTVTCRIRLNVHVQCNDNVRLCDKTGCCYGSISVHMINVTCLFGFLVQNYSYLYCTSWYRPALMLSLKMS